MGESEGGDYFTVRRPCFQEPFGSDHVNGNMPGLTIQLKIYCPLRESYRTALQTSYLPASRTLFFDTEMDLPGNIPSCRLVYQRKYSPGAVTSNASL